MRHFLFGLIFLLVPICYFFPFFVKEKISKNSLIKLGAICILPAILSIGTWAVIRRYSWYEYLLLDSVLAAFFSTIAIPLIIDRKSFSYKFLLKFICFFALSVALYSTMTYGQTIISSDTATATILADSILRHKNLFPSTWNYANGDVWAFSFHLLVLPFVHVIHNQSLLRMIVSAFWILFACGCACKLSKFIFFVEAHFLIIPFFCLFITGSSSYNVVLYEAAYTGQLIWQSVSLMLAWSAYDILNKNGIYVFWRKKEFINVFILSFIVFFLMALGGSRQLGEIVLPLFLTIIVLSIIKIAIENKDLKALGEKTFLLLLMILIPSVLGFICYKHIAITHNVNNTVNNAMNFIGDYQSWWNNFQNIFITHFSNFGIHTNAPAFSIIGLKNFVIIFFTLLISFIIPILQLIKIKNETKPIIFVCLFSLIHNFLMFLLFVFFEKTTARYLLSSQFLEIIVSSRYIYVYWIKKNPSVFARNILVSIIALGVGVNSLYFLRMSKNWKQKLENKKSFASWIMSSGAKKCYATYWNAYTNEVYSNLAIRFGAVNFYGKNFSPYYWLVDSDAYDYSENSRTCLLLSENEKTDSLIVESIFGELEQTLQRDGYTLFVFDYDIARDFPPRAFPTRLNEKMFISTRKLNIPETVKLTDDGFPVSTQIGSEELLAFGPYVHADAGTYKITVLCDSNQPLSGNTAVISCTANSGQKLLCTKELTGNDNKTVFFLNLSQEEDGVEIVIRSFVDGFVLKGYEVELIGNQHDF